MTPAEADAELRKYGPEDLAYAIKYAAGHDVDPAWRDALRRARARELRQTARAMSRAMPGPRPKASQALAP